MTPGLQFTQELQTTYLDPPPIESLPKPGPLILPSIGLVGVGIALVPIAIQNQLLVGVAVILATVLGIAGVAGLIWAGSRATRRAAVKRLLELRSLGIWSQAIDRQNRKHYFDSIKHLDDWLKQGSRGLLTFGETSIETSRGQVPIRLFHHTYTINTGKSSTTITHWVAAAPAPESWPLIRLTTESFFSKIGKKLGLSDIQLDDPAFNDRWLVKCESEDFAIVALSPEVQNELQNAPKNEGWAFGKGYVACVQRAALSPEQLQTLAQRAASIRVAISPELDSF